MTTNEPTTIIALDVGGRRIGVALASNVARLAQPLTTLENSPDVFETILGLIESQHVGEVVVGRPRNLNGQSTTQTKLAEKFAAGLQKASGLPVHLQDEAVTSKQAEAELRSRRREFSKAEVDALAATYILEDYLKETEASRV